MRPRPHLRTAVLTKDGATLSTLPTKGPLEDSWDDSMLGKMTIIRLAVMSRGVIHACSGGIGECNLDHTCALLF